jgi:hypothetical protein
MIPKAKRFLGRDHHAILTAGLTEAVWKHVS